MSHENEQDELIEPHIDNELNRPYSDVVADLSNLAQGFLDERKEYARMRNAIKKRCARVRLFIVNEMLDRLENPEVIEFITKARFNKKTLTLDSINALIGLEIGEDYELYEAAKFNAQTSEKAFPMFQAELTAHQSKIKRDAADMDNYEYVQRMKTQRNPESRQ